MLSSPPTRWSQKPLAWLRALRLQFYPMTWIAYTVGALAAARPRPLDLRAYWLGYLALFVLEAAAVFCNEYFDYESDRRNRNAGPFTGGSRVLVDSALRFSELRAGIAIALGAFAMLLMLLAYTVNTASMALMSVYLTLAFLALAYTAPPIKLSYCGLGELDVALTHSIGVMLLGYLLQGGAWSAPLPWLLGLLLLLAVLPAIILSGVPDCEADQAAGKRTLVVKLGKRKAISVAMLAAVMAAGLAIAWRTLGLVEGVYGTIIYAVVPHAALLLWRLTRYLRQGQPAARIDGLMLLALSYILWFGLVPLLGLGKATPSSPA